MFNLPTLITLFRLVLIPLYVAVFYLPWHLAHVCAALIFILAGMTDWLDGYLARSRAEVTKLGAFLDPVADKLMIAVALVLIVGEKFLPFIAVPAAIMVGREIAMSALREWMAELGKRTVVAVSQLGKAKTVAQFVAITSLTLYHPNPSDSGWMMLWNHLTMGVGYLSLYLAATLTLWSVVSYFKAAWPDLLANIASPT